MKPMPALEEIKDLELAETNTAVMEIQNNLQPNLDVINTTHIQNSGVGNNLTDIKLTNKLNNDIMNNAAVCGSETATVGMQDLVKNESSNCDMAQMGMLEISGML